MPLRVSNGEFYKVYKAEIDDKINQVIRDFAISKNDIINYIESRGIYYNEDNYEHDKVWHVFAPAIECLHGAIMYKPHLSKEEIYMSSLGLFFEDNSEICLEFKVNEKKEKKRIKVYE